MAENKSINQEMIAKIEWCNKGVMYGKEAETAIGQWNVTWDNWGLNDVGVLNSTSMKVTSKIGKSSTQQEKNKMTSTKI